MNIIDTIKWQDKTIPFMLSNSASLWGEKLALITDDGEQYTYKKLYDDVCTLALGFHALGIRKDDHVATILGSRPTYVLASYALMMIGAVVVTINYTFQADEMAFVLDQSDSKYVIMEDDVAGIDIINLLNRIAPEIEKQNPADLRLAKLPKVKSVIVRSFTGKRYAGTITFEDIVHSGQQRDDVLIKNFMDDRRSDDMAFIMYTSGTTAFPKGALRTQGSALGIGYYLTPHASRLTAGDVGISASPFFHIGGCIYNVLGYHLSGCTFVLLKVFDPGKMLELIGRCKVTTIMGFDTHFYRLLKHPNFTTTDLSAITKVRLATGPDSYDKVREMGMGKEVVSHHFGFTEGTGVVMPYEETDYEIRRNSSGKPFPGVELKIVDPETGMRQLAGTAGEICLKGWTLFNGYYKMPEQTAASMDDEGFFHTGDYGWLDEKGYLYYRGRYKQMVKTGGENVSQKEVEIALQEHPDVQTVQVIGLPDSEWGEVVTAVVQTRSGADLTTEQVRKFCRGKLAGFKIPKRVLQIQESEWPVSRVGKIEKMKLRAWAMEKAGIKAD